MKGKKYLEIIAFLCIITLASGFSASSSTVVLTDSLSLQYNTTNTQVRFESETSFHVMRSYYSMEPDSTIVLELNRLPSDLNLQADFTKSPLIQDIQAVNNENQTPSLLLQLPQKMPFTVFNNGKSIVVEINQTQKNLNEYPLSQHIKDRIIHQGMDSSLYLKDIEISKGEDQIDVKANVTDDPIPNVFVLDNPLRLVVDLHNTLASGNSSHHTINKYGVIQLRTGQFQVSNPYTITRMVFDLNEPLFYKINHKEDGLHITFYKNQEFHLAEPVPEVPSVPEKQPVTKEETPVQEKPKNQTQEKPQLEDPEKNGQNKPEKLNGKAESNGSQSQQIQYEPQTISDAETRYTGQPISPKFKDAELRDVVMVISEIAGLNVIFDPGVSGTVTCDFTDIPWDQFLDLILKTNKQGKVIEGNVLRIAPISVLTREQEEQRELAESQELSGPILVRTFTLSYSKAGEVESLLRTKISSRGEIIVDNRTNTLIISDVREKMNLAEKLIDVFDTPTPQVSIEARIVEATSRFIRNLGIQWGWKGIADPFYGNQTTLQFPHKILVDGAQVPQGITTKGIGGPLGGYGINLPAPEFAGVAGFSLANITDTFRLDLALSALERSGSGRIISAPKITTQNNQEAEIIQGRQIPVQTVANFTVTTRYVNAALELRATPQITAEGTIIMTIEIQNNAADFSNLVNGIPPIIRQSAETTVMVPDGGTTVIGGIYRTEDSITRERIPFLHQIPILGNLFKSFSRTKENRELLIFLTPRIIR
ncbi:MAG: type IV pilus secretin PilQ [Candidatus Aminicenantes bacterium]|nr:type IV pilus secretin PilQ [Candidatus Aminicenantes bacterium]